MLQHQHNFMKKYSNKNHIIQKIKNQHHLKINTRKTTNITLTQIKKSGRVHNDINMYTAQTNQC